MKLISILSEEGFQLFSGLSHALCRFIKAVTKAVLRLNYLAHVHHQIHGHFHWLGFPCERVGIVPALAPIVLGYE